MPREAIEHLARQHPVLVDLRRELDEVARRRRQPRIRDVLQQAMQRVAELVEQRLRIVERDQHRLAGAPFTKLLLFDVIGGDRAVSVSAPGSSMPRRPSACRTRKAVEVEQPAMRPGGRVLHLPHAHVGMEDRHLAGDLGKARS